MGLSPLGIESRQLAVERVDKGLNTRKNCVGVGTRYLCAVPFSPLNSWANPWVTKLDLKHMH